LNIFLRLSIFDIIFYADESAMRTRVCIGLSFSSRPWNPFRFFVFIYENSTASGYIQQINTLNCVHFAENSDA